MTEAAVQPERQRLDSAVIYLRGILASYPAELRITELMRVIGQLNEDFVKAYVEPAKRPQQPN